MGRINVTSPIFEDVMSNNKADETSRGLGRCASIGVSFSRLPVGNFAAMFFGLSGWGLKIKATKVAHRLQAAKIHVGSTRWPTSPASEMGEQS